MSELERVLADVADIDDRHEYFRAVTVLRERLRPETVEAAVALLREADDEAVRRAAAELLGADVGDRMAAERLEDAALIGGLREPLEAVAMELGRLRATDGITTLRVLAVHDDDGVRRAAAQGLGGLVAAVPQAAGMLVALSSDPSPLVRGRATHELGRSGVDTPEARDALAARLEEEDLDIRFDAARGLGELGDPRALEVVLDLSGTRFTGATLDLAAIRLAAATGDRRLAAMVERLDPQEWRDSPHAAEYERARAALLE